MKNSSKNNILTAFLLNLTFTIIEVVGGIFTNSIAILSDAVHDFGDSISIGLSYFLEKKAEKGTNGKFTFGYARLRILSAFITSAILFVGSGFVLYESILRLINPEEINSMWIFIISIFGILFNGLAVFKTNKSENINEKAINLHILEDVLGWAIVFVGSILMWAFNIVWLDSFLSIFVTAYIVYHVIKNLITIFGIFLESAPNGININDFKEHILSNQKIKGIHHVHIWSLDGQIMIATCHIVVKNECQKNDLSEIKCFVKGEALEHGIQEIILEIEFENEICKNIDCHVCDCKSSKNEKCNHCHFH